MSDSTISGSDAIEPSPRLYNEDLAPARERNWGTYSLFAMWMSDVHSIGGYTFAAGLFFTGLVGWQVFVALVLGITVVFFLMNLTGFAGQATGVPYPVIARISFGVFGANLAALIRAVIAIAWYGIQTWLASQAVVVLAIAAWPGLADHRGGNFLGLDVLGWAAFAVLWVLQLLVIRRGMETVRRFQDWAGPAIWVVMFVLAAWIVIEAGSDFSLNLTDEQKTGGAAVQAFLVACALTITYFSTLLLNFCDFSRFAPDRPTVVRGNFWGLPDQLHGIRHRHGGGHRRQHRGVRGGDHRPRRDRRQDQQRLGHGHRRHHLRHRNDRHQCGRELRVGQLRPRNVAPKHIDFRRGGLISAIAAVVITPWHLYSSPDAIFYFLGGLGALLGPLFGVIFTDYYLIRRQRVSIEELYLDDPRSRYYYRRGWNPKALIAGGVAAVFSLFVALTSRGRSGRRSPGSSVCYRRVLYYAISARDFRQPELEGGNAVMPRQLDPRRPSMTDLDLVIRAPA